jgi:hypothetical protein
VTLIPRDYLGDDNHVCVDGMDGWWICQGEVAARTNGTVGRGYQNFASAILFLGDTHKYCKVLMCLEEPNIPCVTPTQT